MAYQAALHFYSQAILPGTSRKEVETYLRENKLAFRQTCCVDMKEFKKGSLDDLVQIGEEDAPWFCNSLIVYIGFQFTGPGNFDVMKGFRSDDSDKLKAVTLCRQYDKCL